MKAFIKLLPALFVMGCVGTSEPPSPANANAAVNRSILQTSLSELGSGVYSPRLPSDAPTAREHPNSRACGIGTFVGDFVNAETNVSVMIVAGSEGSFSPASDLEQECLADPDAFRVKYSI
jgi:hypothetical protein